VVVKVTNAVNATRKTLNESTKKSSSATSMGPWATTRIASLTAAARVTKATTALNSAARLRSPNSASSRLPASGKPRTSRISIAR
jgi:hypothetical protein